MGKMLIIVIAGAFVLYSIGSLNISRSNTEMISDAVEIYEATGARNNAASGIDFAIKSLSVDSTWSGINNKSVAEGSVNISVVNTSAKYYLGSDAGLTRARLITSIGTWGEKKDTIRAVIQLPTSSGSGSGSVPGFLKYAVASNGNLNLNGNVNIRDDNNSSWNANVHTNGDFNMNGNNLIEGFLTYKSEANSNPSWKLNSQIVPNNNPDNLPNRSQTELMDIPDFKAEDFAHLATQTFNSNKTYSGNITLGTKENPAIIYINGDLTIKGSISGYGMFLVKGNVTVNGNVSVTMQDPTGNNMGLYTNGNINVNGNVTLRGQLFSQGNINLGGNSKVYGAMTSRGNVNFNGNVNVYYRPVTSALTDPLWAGESEGTSSLRPTIISYYE